MVDHTALRTGSRVGGSDSHQVERAPGGKIVVVVVVLAVETASGVQAASSARPVAPRHRSAGEERVQALQIE